MGGATSAEHAGGGQTETHLPGFTPLCGAGSSLDLPPFPPLLPPPVPVLERSVMCPQEILQGQAQGQTMWHVSTYLSGTGVTANKTQGSTLTGGGAIGRHP